MHRRDLIKLGAATMAATLQPTLLAASTERNADPTSLGKEPVEQWSIFEVTLPGPSTGNPFKDVTFTAAFTSGHRTVQATGFYDGEGVYRVRFMPDATGDWTYVTAGSVHELHGHSGAFTCTAPSTLGNHGPVGVAHQFHFQYADGTPYFPLGTTTYAYLFTSDENAQASLAGMKQAQFNKTRVCVLPKPLGKGPQILPFPNTGASSDG